MLFPHLFFVLSRRNSKVFDLWSFFRHQTFVTRYKRTDKPNNKLSLHRISRIKLKKYRPGFIAIVFINLCYCAINDMHSFFFKSRSFYLPRPWHLISRILVTVTPYLLSVAQLEIWLWFISNYVMQSYYSTFLNLSMLCIRNIHL